jgi:hypothetical protein
MQNNVFSTTSRPVSAHCSDCVGFPLPTQSKGSSEKPHERHLCALNYRTFQSSIKIHTGDSPRGEKVDEDALVEGYDKERESLLLIDVRKKEN